MVVTKEQIKSIAPRIRASTLDVLPAYLNDFCPKYGINSPTRMAAFLAQIAHESGGFTALQENLNYKAQGLVGTFRKHFPTLDIAEQYAGRPEAIANRAYAGKNGNGPESSGDGWRYRGRGLIQITGRNNYAACSRSIYKDEAVLLNNPDYLATTIVAVQSACVYWKDHGLNDIADKPAGWTILWKGRQLTAFEYITVRINGGLTGLDERLRYWGLAKSVFLKSA